MMIGNFTPDAIPWMHIGVEGTINPGEVVEVDESRGNHILNNFAARGLVRLEFGCDEAVKRDESRRRYVDFWRRQIIMFNQRNEARKNSSIPYDFPTPEIQAHAEKLGVELVQPWTMKESVDEKKLKKLEEANTELRDQLSKVVSQMGDMMTFIGGVREEEYRKKFHTKTKTQLRPFIEDNMGEIMSWPPRIQLELIRKFEDMYSDEQCPIPMPSGA